MSPRCEVVRLRIYLVEHTFSSSNWSQHVLIAISKNCRSTQAKNKISDNHLDFIPIPTTCLEPPISQKDTREKFYHHGLHNPHHPQRLRHLRLPHGLQQRPPRREHARRQHPLQTQKRDQRSHRQPDPVPRVAVRGHWSYRLVGEQQCIGATGAAGYCWCWACCGWAGETEGWVEAWVWAEDEGGDGD